MRSLYLSLINISKLLKTQKLIISIIITGISISSMALVYFISFNYNILHEKEINDFNLRKYLISFNRDTAVSEKLKFIYTVSNSDELPLLTETGIFFKSNVFFKNKLFKNIIIGAYYPKKNILFLCEGNDDINKQEKDNKNNAIIAKEFVTGNIEITNIGKKIDIENQVYTISGVLGTTYESQIIIPYNTYLQNRYDVYFASFIFSRKLSPKEQKYLINLLNSCVPDAKISIPPKIDKEAYMNYILRMIISVLIITFTLINVLTLFRYIIMIRKDEFAVYILCGIQAANVIRIIAGEIFIISSISYFLGVILILIIKLFLGFMQINLQNKIDAYHYISGFLIICILSILSIFKFICNTISSKKLIQT